MSRRGRRESQGEESIVLGSERKGQAERIKRQSKLRRQSMASMSSATLRGISVRPPPDVSASTGHLRPVRSSATLRSGNSPRSAAKKSHDKQRGGHSPKKSRNEQEKKEQVKIL